MNDLLRCTQALLRVRTPLATVRAYAPDGTEVFGWSLTDDGPLVPAPVDPVPLEQLTQSTLRSSVETMLRDLGDPPLVDRIYPDGWRRERDLRQLYELCLRTYAQRERDSRDTRV